MKTNLFSVVLLFLVFNVNGNVLTIHEQLRQLNSNWDYHQEDDKILTQNHLFHSDQELIQLHLKLVEQTLRTNCNINLTEDQKNKRFQLLNVLHDYWVRGVFPVNTNHKIRTPYFIDVYGTACAVGQLIISSGHFATANKISKENNNGYIFDLAIKYPQIKDWANSYGFTLEELAWIQPCYQPAPDTMGLRNPTCHNAMNGYFCPDFSSMQAPLTKSFYRLNENGWEVYIDMCGDWQFHHLTAGKYKWEVIDGLNATHTFSIDLIAPPPATITLIKTGDFNSCNGIITTSVQGGVPPFKYYWSGHTTSTTSILSSVCEELVTLTFYEGGLWCPQFSEILTSPVGLQENAIKEVQISPNPVKDILHLSFNIATQYVYQNAKIFDASGRLIMQVAIKTEEATIDLSRLSSGLYFLQVGNLKMQRVLKE